MKEVKPLEGKNLLKIQDEILRAENFNEYIICLYSLGRFLQEDFSKNNGIDRIDRKAFREYIQKLIDVHIASKPYSTEINGLVKELWEKLRNLRIFLEVWEDPRLYREDKKERHANKYKKNISKPIRRSVRVALYFEIIELAKGLIDLAEEKDLRSEILTIIKWQLEAVDTTGANEKVNTSRLMVMLSNCIHLLETIEPNSILPEDIKEKYEKAAKAISTFKTPADKCLRGIGVSVGFFSGLAFGLATGVCIFSLVLVPFGVIAAGLVGFFVFLAGFISNFVFFSKDMSSFLLSVAKIGGITEFIDEKGERVQLSRVNKFFLFVAALVSLAVGIAGAAIILSHGPAIMGIVSFLAVLWPPLPLILLCILAVTACVVLTLAMFKAFVSALQKPFPSFKSFSKTIKFLSFSEWTAYAVKAIIISFAVFGLFFLSLLALPVLVPSFGTIISLVIVCASFAGQIPFTILTVNALCDAFARFAVSPRIEIRNFFRVGVLGPLRFLGVIVNAVGSAALVVTKSLSTSFITIAHCFTISCISIAPCFIISWAACRTEGNKNQEIRERADEESIERLKSIAPKTSVKAPLPPGFKLNRSKSFSFIAVDTDAANTLSHKDRTGSNTCEFFRVDKNREIPTSLAEAKILPLYATKK